MTDVLVLVERVRNTIRLGESQFREFKSAFEGPPGAKRPRRWVDICRAVAEGLVAFANADGGEMLVGVEDDGTISGVPYTLEEIEKILNASKTHVHPDSKLPMQFATSLRIDDKVVLFFSVAKGTEEIYQLPDGRCVRRVGANTNPESVDRILFDRREVRSRSNDSEFIDGAQVTDLDINRLQSMADEYLTGITAEKYLQQIGLAEFALGGLRLRRAAVLLFAKDIQRWHPRCQVRILKVQGNVLKSGNDYNVTSDQFVQGNIFELLGRSWEALRPFLAYKTEFGIDARFEQKYIYPEGACREALVNAIAHRDFVIQNGIDIFVYDDRMEIKSPGSLLSTLTLGQLLRLEGSHESRNALIARALRESGYMRELGEGMKRIFRLMEESDLIQPNLNTDLSTFIVTLFNRSVFNDQQRFWLSMFDQ
jgi:ATP-dependent DNA helicase RecG